MRSIAAALRQERKLRAYLTGSIVDDVGVAVSAWGMQLLMTNLFTDQRQRAKLMMPTLLCFLAGCLVAGPLADWGARLFPEGLPARRWRLVIWARLLETLALGAAMWGVSRGTPSIARMLPYFMISAFTKTALRPTRIAFEVDLLQKQQPQLDENGAQILDEGGRPRMYKLHLLAFESLSSFLRSAAVLGGLLLGGKILAAAGGRYLPLLAIDVGTNLAFIAVVLFTCHPDGDARWRDLFGGEGPVHRSLTAGRSLVVESLREVGASFADAARFLAGRAQRPLLWLLFGCLMVEVVNEFYDGKMIVKHVLSRGDDPVRYADILWTSAGMVAAALLPLLARRVNSLGKIFLAAMLLDGVVIALAGRIAGGGALAPLFPFVALLGADKALTVASGSLASLAQNSASSAGMRGRIAAAFALVVILADLGAEWAATEVSERVGLAAMIQWIGAVQVALMVLVAVLGGRQLWRFGLRSAPPA